MLIIERLRLIHRFRKHEGFLSSLSQCCVHGLGMQILGVTLADLSGSERSGDCFRCGIHWLLLSLCFWHCDFIELDEWRIHLRPASLPWICILLTASLQFGTLSGWIKEFPHSSRMPGGPAGATGQCYLNRPRDMPGISVLCMPMAPTSRLLISFWRARSINPSLFHT